jgi:hypothetical protein
MIDPSLKLSLEHILTPREYPTNPHILEFEDEQWKSWLESEKAVCVNWRLHSEISQKGFLFFTFYSMLSLIHSSDSDRKRLYKWKLRYICDHAGQPRDRRDPKLSPSKRRKSGNSIKVGCEAKIHIHQAMGSGKIFVEYHWRHNNHSTYDAINLDLFYFIYSQIQDPSTLQNMQESRNPDAVREWLDARVDEGFDMGAIKAMLRMTSEQLSEVFSFFLSLHSTLLLTIYLDYS